MFKCDTHSVPERSLRETLENILSSVISKKTYTFDDKEQLLTSLESLYNCPVCSRERNVNRNMQGISVNMSSIDNGIVPKLNRGYNNIPVISPFSYKIDSTCFLKILLGISIDIPDNYSLLFYPDEFFTSCGLFFSFPFQKLDKNLILIVYNFSEEHIIISRNDKLGYFVPYYSPTIDNINHIDKE